LADDKTDRDDAIAKDRPLTRSFIEWQRVADDMLQLADSLFQVALAEARQDRKPVRESASQPDHA
jgi:hypothetical protein